MTRDSSSPPVDTLFTSAQWYDRSINWSARIAREVPVLTDVFGPPGEGRILDAGCGTARQVRALAELGYNVVGADASEEMIDEARRVVAAVSQRVELVVTPYAELYEHLRDGFDGAYCLGNALAAAGAKEEVARAIRQFSRCIRPGGRLFVQVLNFAPMRAEQPCVRGPRVASVAGRDYISCRQFHFFDDHALVTNITVWQDQGWHKRAHSGRLYPVGLEELRVWFRESNLRIDNVWGSYAREPYDAACSPDLIVAATRTP